jgi:acyl-CoA dehydrogenase
VLSVDESGRPLLHADMLPARYAGLRDQVRGFGFTDEHALHRLTTRLWAWREEYGNHAIWSERLGSVLAGKDGLTLWQRMTR